MAACHLRGYAGLRRARGAKTLRESEGSQVGPLGAREVSPPASEASDAPRSGEQVALSAAHNTG